MKLHSSPFFCSGSPSFCIGNPAFCNGSPSRRPCPLISRPLAHVQVETYISHRCEAFAAGGLLTPHCVHGLAENGEWGLSIDNQPSVVLLAEGTSAVVRAEQVKEMNKVAVAARQAGGDLRFFVGLRHTEPEAAGASGRRASRGVSDDGRTWSERAIGSTAHIRTALGLGVPRDGAAPEMVLLDRRRRTAYIRDKGASVCDFIEWYSGQCSGPSACHVFDLAVGHEWGLGEKPALVMLAEGVGATGAMRATEQRKLRQMLAEVANGRAVAGRRSDRPLGYFLATKEGAWLEGVGDDSRPDPNNVMNMVRAKPQGHTKPVTFTAGRAPCPSASGRCPPPLLPTGGRRSSRISSARG